jgi:hypothetical protein
MKRFPRIRKATKWLITAATGTVLLMWLASGWIDILWESQRSCRWAHIGEGVATIGWTTWISDFGGTYIESHPFRIQLLHPLFVSTDSISIHISLAGPTVLAILVTIATWRLDDRADRRARPNLCPTCAYDLTGLAANTTCPECGSAPTKSAHHA